MKAFNKIKKIIKEHNREALSKALDVLENAKNIHCFFCDCEEHFINGRIWFDTFYEVYCNRCGSFIGIKIPNENVIPFSSPIHYNNGFKGFCNIFKSESMKDVCFEQAKEIRELLDDIEYRMFIENESFIKN